MRWSRIVLVALAAALGFGVGFYLGFFALLSVVDLNEFEGWQFELATVPTAGVVAGVAAAAASPSPRRWVAVVGTAVVVAIAVTGGLSLIDGDFGIAFGIGGPIVAIAAVSAAAITGRHGESA